MILYVNIGPNLVFLNDKKIEKNNVKASKWSNMKHPLYNSFQLK